MAQYFATLTYDPNDGSSSWSETEYGENAQGYGYVTFSLPTLSRTGYTFDGWYFNGSLRTGSSITLYGDSNGESYSVTASWTAIPVTYTIGADITYDPANGDPQWAIPAVTTTSSNPYGYVSTTMDAAPTWTGHTFQYWSIAGVQRQPGQSITLYATTQIESYTATAVWSTDPSVSISVTVEFDNDGGTPASETTTYTGTSQPGETSGYLTVTTPSTAPTKVGYNFAGWMVQGTLKGVSVSFSEMAIQGGRTQIYYAQYVAKPSQGVNIYDGGWHTADAYIWNGSAWVKYEPYIYDGSWKH